MDSPAEVTFRFDFHFDGEVWRQTGIRPPGWGIEAAAQPALATTNTSAFAVDITQVERAMSLPQLIQFRAHLLDPALQVSLTNLTDIESKLRLSREELARFQSLKAGAQSRLASLHTELVNLRKRKNPSDEEENRMDAIEAQIPTEEKLIREYTHEANLRSYIIPHREERSHLAYCNLASLALGRKMPALSASCLAAIQQYRTSSRRAEALRVFLLDAADNAANKGAI
jgi:hypothetical protein